MDEKSLYAHILNLSALWQVKSLSLDENAASVTVTVGIAEKYSVDLSLKVTQGSVLLIRLAGELQFAKLMGSSFITAEGESIEGEALEDVEVLGVATHD
ncbi:transposase, ISL3 family [Klebsiella pneumoniae]|jgi:hypothetical protein|nr:transposase, ISL3 family [Klebsiella pneumoniae]SWX22634.1 transposase, ISL3 family [Klebsiella pneumoniae]